MVCTGSKTGHSIYIDALYSHRSVLYMYTPIKQLYEVIHMDILILTAMMAVPLIGLCSLPLIAKGNTMQSAIPVSNRNTRR